MTEAEWLECTNPQGMLEFLRGKASDRKLRLFACACSRRVWHLLGDNRSRKVVEVAERYGDGCASEDELWQTHLDARVALDELPEEGITPAKDAAYTALAAGFHSRGARNYTDIGSIGLIDAADRAAVYSHCACEPPDNDNFSVEATLLRHIIGNPFCSITSNPAWLTPTVQQLATAIYEERSYERFPILADALEEAGCVNADILTHCRQPGVHVRGCWALDLILGKE